MHKIGKDSAAIGKLYGCKSTCGDNYAGEWPREAFLEHGIVCEPCELGKPDLLPSGDPARIDHGDFSKAAAAYFREMVVGVPG